MSCAFNESFEQYASLEKLPIKKHLLHWRNIGADKKVDFFLECSSYDVILPVKVKGDSKLDVFEEAVLKLIAYKSTTSEDMADILCLTPDLINFIIISFCNKVINLMLKRTYVSLYISIHFFFIFLIKISPIK